jgi:ribulose-phosphate 3-epimerase
MAVVCPTVTVETNDPHHFREQMERVAAFASRVHIDLMDGEFAKTRSINPIQVWWPETIEADIHLMFRRPSEHLETLVSLNPSLVIFHAESEGDVVACMTHLKRFGIKVGIALLQYTSVVSAKEMIEHADHVLIFAGKLGSFGGEVDYSLLDKVEEVKAYNPQAEIGWDGGVNDKNSQKLAMAGIDVLDVGGFIQRSDAPAKAFRQLVESL